MTCITMMIRWEGRKRDSSWLRKTSIVMMRSSLTTTIWRIESGKTVIELMHLQLKLAHF